MERANMVSVRIDGQQLVDILRESHRYVLYYPFSDDYELCKPYYKLYSQLGFVKELNGPVHNGRTTPLHSLEAGCPLVVVVAEPSLLDKTNGKVSKINSQCEVKWIPIAEADQAVSFIRPYLKECNRNLPSDELSDYRELVARGNLLWRNTEKPHLRLDPPIKLTTQLYLGSQGSLDQKYLDVAGIDRIFHFKTYFHERPTELFTDSTELGRPIRCYHVNDQPEDIDRYRECLVDLDSVVKPTESTLIICGHGMSRSPTAIIYLLMKRSGCSLSTAFDHVYTNRPILNPLKVMIDELRTLDGSLSICPHVMGPAYWNCVFLRSVFERCDHSGGKPADQISL